MDLTFWIVCSVSKAVAEAAAVVTLGVTFLLVNQPVAVKHLVAVLLNQPVAAKHLAAVLLNLLAVAKHLVAVLLNQPVAAKHLAAVLLNQPVAAKHLVAVLLNQPVAAKYLVAVLLNQLAVAKYHLATADVALLAAQRAVVDCYRSCSDAKKDATVAVTAVATCHLADVKWSQLVAAKHLADVQWNQLAVAKHHLATADAVLVARRRRVAFLASCSAT